MGPPDAAPTPLYATGPGNTYRPETTPAVRRRRVNHDSDSDSSTVSATSTTSSSSGSIELNHPRYQEDPQDVIFRKKQRKGKKIKRKPSRHRRRSSLGSLPRTASLASLRSEIDFVEQREDKSGSALKALLELYEDLKARVRKLEPEHQPHDENPATSEKTDKSVKPALDETGDDGDDEGANDEKADDEKNVDDEEQAPGRKFDLATQLFYRPDEEDQRLFNDTVIYPFIRVRWDDLYSSGPEAILEDPKNKGDYSAGSVGLNEICIDSPVFKHFIEEYADSLTVQPPPPPKILGNEDHTISFYKPFRWLIQNQEVFKDKVKSLEQEKQLVVSTDSNRSSSLQLRPCVEHVSGRLI
ncbi:hypothetical protein BJ170DRAFT_266125 [Xylariales sp. AK1849]|nr:hypothetical protein BJ170DRAFT_266125 [Xylariales sp. AK1849]